MSEQFRFTKSKVEALPPALPGQRVEYRDAATPGLRLRVSRTSKTYVVLARKKGGGLERITIGPADKLTPDNARERAKRIIADLAVGVSHAAPARAKRGEQTFAELVADYLAATTMRPRSLAAYQWIYEKRVGPDLGRRKLSEVTPERVRALQKNISANTPTTANRCVSLIRAAFNWAAREGTYTGANPAAHVKKNVEVSRTRYLQPSELDAFYQALGEAEEPAKSFFTLCLLTGARRSNVLGMRWADVQLDDAIWRIPAADAKAGQEMNIPLVPEAVAVLRDIKTRLDFVTPWVFPADSTTGHYQEPKRAWATLRRRSGLADLRIHDLRRTMGSWLVRTGSSTAVNMAALGHRSLQAASVYARIADADPVRAAMGKAASALLGGRQ